ncbi:hypothetical protein GWK18_10470 [Kocuria sp. JC486]|nr:MULTISPECIES: hypothetical protein [Kocuria]NHU86000.1 hypothetical protein [Kocuria sp. JC486]
MTRTAESAPSSGQPNLPLRLERGMGEGPFRLRRGLSGVFLAVVPPALRLTTAFAVPFVSAAWLLAPFLGATPAVLCAVSVLICPAAFVAHELAHAAVYTILAPADAPEAKGHSTVWTAHVERGALPAAQDVLVTLAGPLVGLAVAVLPQLSAWVVGASLEIHVALVPSSTFALQHLGSILPGTDDFTALIEALRESRTVASPSKEQAPGTESTR